MAGSVKVNIPGVGTIEATNAASESTLLEILDAVKKSGTSGGKTGSNSAEALKKQQDNATEGLKKYTKELVNNSGKSEKIITGTNTAMSAVTDTLISLTKTAASLTSAFMTSYDQMRDNPLDAALTVMQTEVDATATLYKGAANAILIGAGTLFGGPVGAAIGAVIGEGIGKLIDSGAEMQKTYNDQMGKEMKKSVAALSEYSKMGASFAGGMSEMRTMANDAGLSMDTLSKAAMKASSDLGQSGLTHGEATHVMAKGMEGLAKTTGKSGAALRDELLSMGYSYEEQGEVMASFMAQQRAAGKNLQNLAPDELARGAREYATNLKVISDITGQDAKKLQEKARAESMRGALQGKLSEEQNKAFVNANSVLGKFGPEVQNALTQFMATGQITDPAIAANKELMGLIQQTAQSVQAGDKDIASITADRMKTAQEGMKTDETVRASSLANLMGAGQGVAGQIAKVGDTILAAQIGSGTAAKEAAESMGDLAGKTGSVEQGFAQITSKTQDLSVEMEKLTGSHLGEYAQDAARGFKAAEENITKLAKAIDKVHGSTIQPAAQVGAKALESGAGSMMSLFNSYAGFANGGIASGPREGFVEKLHGVEAVVPLPDGNSIPVSVDMPSFESLAQKIDALIGAMSSGATTTAASTGGSTIADAFNGLHDMMARHLDVSKEMAGHAKDNKDLVQKLLNVSM